MADEKRDLLAVLRAELEFLEKGGYRRPSWRPNFIFEDSPTCLNASNARDVRPCSECALMQFVPGGKRQEKIPCRHIPLDAAGTTLQSLYKTGTQDELEAAIGNWLKAMIQALEGERSKKVATRALAKATSR